MRTYAELDQDMSRFSRDAGNINAWMRSYTPDRRDELTLLAQQQQQTSLALDACFAEKNLLDILKREQELKDLLQKQEQQIKELQKKEEFQKADAAEKERQSKDLLAKQGRDKQELLQKQERDKQENEKREILRKQELQAQEQQLKEMLLKEEREKQEQLRAQEQQLADSNARRQENFVSDIVKETAYAAGQAVDAAAEAAAEIAKALRNAVSEREANQYFEEQKKRLGAFVLTDDFQAQSADTKERWLAERIREQERETREKFGDRPDDYGNRKDLNEKLAALNERVMETVKSERDIEMMNLAKSTKLKDSEEKAYARLDNSGQEQAAIEAEKQRVADKAAEIARENSERDERKRQELWDKLCEELRLEKELAEREEARKREEAARAAAARDALGL
jgi:hypothetical protein